MLRDVSLVLIISGSLLLVDAAVTVLWQEPVTAVIDSVRALLSGHAAGPAAVTAVAWSVGIVAVSVLAAGVLFGRRAA